MLSIGKIIGLATYILLILADNWSSGLHNWSCSCGILDFF